MTTLNETTPAAILDAEVNRTVLAVMSARLGMTVEMDVDGAIVSAEMPLGALTVTVTNDRLANERETMAAARKLATMMRKRLRAGAGVRKILVRQVETGDVDWEAPAPPEGFEVLIAAGVTKVGGS